MPIIVTIAGGLAGFAAACFALAVFDAKMSDALTLYFTFNLGTMTLIATSHAVHQVFLKKPQAI